MRAACWSSRGPGLSWTSVEGVFRQTVMVPYTYVGSGVYSLSVCLSTFSLSESVCLSTFCLPVCNTFHNNPCYSGCLSSTGYEVDGLVVLLTQW